MTTYYNMKKSNNYSYGIDSTFNTPRELISSISKVLMCKSLSDTELACELSTIITTQLFVLFAHFSLIYI